MNEIIAQFTQEASFLWFLRDSLINEPHISLQNLAERDERLEAHIDGLRVAGDNALAVCKEALESNDPEALFAPALLAFESNDNSRIVEAIGAAKQDQKKIRVLVSALGWLPFQQALPHIEKLLTADSAYQRYIGIAACAIQRHDPGLQLDRAAQDPFPLLSARALRAYGELGKSIRLNSFDLRENLSDDDDGICFSTAWSAAMSGNLEAVGVLKKFVSLDSPDNEKALNMAIRRMEPAAAAAWQRELAASPEMVRLAVIAAGIIGHTTLIPWLIDRMNTPELARVAGEAFTMITGIDNELAEMQGEQPEGFDAGPNGDPQDSNVAMDKDGNLPWPNAELLAAWWDKHQGDFPGSVRYLLGKPVTVDHLRYVLENGLQRQRAAAALELAILQPGRPLFNVMAPCSRQLKEVVGV